MDGVDMHFGFLLSSRALRSIAIIYMALAVPLYLHSIGISISHIGLIYTGVMLFMVVLSLLLGMVGDRFGYKKALMLSEIPPIIGGIMLWLSGNIYVMVIAVVIIGVGGVAGGMRGSFSPGMTAMIASHYGSDEDRVKRLSMLTRTSSAFSIVGALLLVAQSFLGGSLGIAGSYRLFFLVASLLFLMSFASLVFVRENGRPRKSTRVMKRSSAVYTMKVAFLNLVNGAALGLSIPLLPLIIEEAFRLSVQTMGVTIGLVYIPSYVGVALGSYLAGRRRGTDTFRIAYLARMSNGIFLVIMGFVVSLQYFGVAGPSILLVAVTGAYAARSVVSGFGSPSIQTTNIKGIDKEDYGTSSSLQSIAMNSAMSSSGVSGYLVEYMLPMPLVVGGLLQLAGGFLYSRVLRRG